MFCVCWECTWHGDVGGVDGAQTVVGEDERVPVLQVNLQEVVEVVVDVEHQGVTLDGTKAEDEPGGQGPGDGLRVKQLLHVHRDGVSVQQIRLRASQVHHVVANIWSIRQNVNPFSAGTLDVRIWRLKTSDSDV